MADDLRTIREALAYYQHFFGVDPAALPAVEALAVLERLEGQVLPPLPPGWHLVGLQEAMPQRAHWFVVLGGPGIGGGCAGSGSTPRAAVLDALTHVAEATDHSPTPPH